MKSYLLLALFLAAVLTAASPVGMVSGSGFELGGASVRTDGVPSWPLVAGSPIKTFTTPVLIRMKDGSRVTLRAGSHAVVEQRAGGLAFRLLSGAMSVAPASNSNLQYFRNSDLVSAPVSPSVPTAKSAAFEVAVPAAPTVGKVASPAVTLVDPRRPPPAPVSSR